MTEIDHCIVVGADDVEVISDDFALDIGDLLLVSLGELVCKFRAVFGKPVRFRDIEIDVPEGDASATFEQRLSGVIDVAKNFESEYDYHEIVAVLLFLDGWSWNENVFRSPIWMNDHRELPIGEARQIRGLEWLGGSSLEIKSILGRASG